MAKPCIICEPGRPVVLYRLPALNVLECQECGLAYVDESLTQTELKELYRAENYYEENFSFYVPGIEAKIIEDNLESFLPVSKYAVSGRILDLGCADGAFLERLDPARWERHGIDLSEEAIQKARRRESWEDIKFHTGELADAGLPAEYFDVVTLWMVVEHLKDPRSLLKEINRILKKGGIVVLKTPNRDSLLSHLAHWFYRLLGRRAVRPLSLYYTALHLYFYDPKTLSMLLQKTGFHVVEVLQEERYVTKHALSRFGNVQGALLRFAVGLSRLLKKMDSVVVYAQKRMGGGV